MNDPRFELFVVNDPRSELFVGLPAGREFEFAARFVLTELGGVNVRQPGREDAIGALPRLAFTVALVLGFTVDDGRSNEFPPRALLLKLVAGRDVPVGRDATLALALVLGPKLFGEPLVRDAVKKCCELDGACR